VNVNFFEDDIVHVLHITKSEPTSFSKLNDSKLIDE